MNSPAAALAFFLLSGMSIAAFRTLPIKDVNHDANTVRQQPADGVCTKYHKAMVTALLINIKLMKIIREWDEPVCARCPLESSLYV